MQCSHPLVTHLSWLVWMCTTANASVLLLFAHELSPCISICGIAMSNLEDNTQDSCISFALLLLQALWCWMCYKPTLAGICQMHDLSGCKCHVFCVQVDAINYHVFANVWGTEWPLAWSGSTWPCETHMLGTQFEVRPCRRATQHMLLWLASTISKRAMLHIACAALHPCTDFRACIHGISSAGHMQCFHSATPLCCMR